MKYIRTVMYLFLCAPLCALGDVLTTVASFDVGAPAADVKLAGRMQIALVHLNKNMMTPEGIQIIDIGDPLHIRKRGFLAIESIRKVVVAADGSVAQVLSEVERTTYGKNGRYLLFDLNISNPDKPVIVSKLEFSVERFELLSSATSYALVTKKREGGSKSNIEIFDFKTGKKLYSLQEEYFDRIQFSENGRFLVFGTSRRFIAYDFGRGAPLRYEQDYSFVERYSCPAYVFDSGQLLAFDEISGGASIYSINEKIPRESLVSGGRGWCGSFVGRVDDSLYYVGDGVLSQFDARDKKSILLSHSVSTAGSYPAALDSRGYMFGLRENQVEVFRLGAEEQEKIDWVALRAAHSQAMTIYGANKGSVGDIYKAISLLEAAKIRVALDFDQRDVSPVQLSAIINDYGFLLSKAFSNAALPRAERALRRSIDIDPNRRLAYLNLADLLRSNMQLLTTTKEKRERSSEIERLYRQYLGLGGKSSAAIDEFLRRNLSNDSASTICHAIADYANMGRLNELMSAGRGVLVDGVRLDLVFTTEGTAHVPAWHTFDAKSGVPVEDALPISEEENFWGGDELSLVVFKNQIHILHYRDPHHPVKTFSLDGSSSCGFEIAFEEVADGSSSEPELCEQIKSGKEIPYINLYGESYLSSEELRNLGYSETGTRGSELVDVDGDGVLENILALQVASGSGPGCDGDFYDILDASGKTFSSSRVRDLFLEMQGISESNWRIVPHCGNSAGFFKYKNAVYYENKPSIWPPRDLSDQYHYVKKINKERIETVCEFSFKSRVRS